MDSREYFQFGELKLTASSGLYDFGGSKGYDFAEYSLAEGKNIIKPIGEKLKTISLSITLSSFLGDNIPDVVDTIDKMMASAEAYPILFVNGLYKGQYVITDITDKIKNTLPSGEILEYDFTLQIKEFNKRTVLSQNVERNSKFKKSKQTTISERDKTKKMNSKMPQGTKLKK